MMQIVLNDEQWELSDEVTLFEALAQVSDRAKARQHLVVTLEVGGRPVTDRDLQPDFLSQTGRLAGVVRATSQHVTEITAAARGIVEAYGQQLKQEGAALASALRRGEAAIAGLDGWLGRLADYVEAVEQDRGHTSAEEPNSLVPWIAELLEARSRKDAVRMGDLLQYELLVRLPGADERVP
jgi:sulfur carrier protein ThiS